MTKGPHAAKNKRKKEKKERRQREKAEGPEAEAKRARLKAKKEKKQQQAQELLRMVADTATRVVREELARASSSSTAPWYPPSSSQWGAGWPWGWW